MILPIEQVRNSLKAPHFRVELAFWIAKVLLLLVGIGVIPISQPALRVAAVLLTYVVVPGQAILSLFGVRYHTLFESTVAAFAVGVSVWFVIGTGAILLGSNIKVMVAFGTGLALASLLYQGLSLWLPLWRGHASSTCEKPLWWRSGERLYHAMFLVATFAATASLWVLSTPFLPTDRWTYLAFIRHFLDASAFLSVGFRVTPDRILESSREAIQPWPLLLATVIELTQADALRVYVYYVPYLLAILACFAVYFLTVRLFGSRQVACSATVLSVLLYMTDIYSTDDGNLTFYLRLIEDKFTLRYILLPVAFGLTVQYYRAGGWRLGAITSFVVVAVGLVHPLGVLLYAMVTGAFWLLGLFFDNKLSRKASTLRGLPLGIVIFFTAVSPLLQRLTAQGTFYEMAAESLSPLRMSRLLFLSTDLSNYIVSPKLLAHPLILLPAVLTLGFIPSLQRKVSSRFVVSSVFVPLLLCFTPYLTPLVGQYVTPWLLWRFLWVIPTGTILAAVVHLLPVVVLRLRPSLNRQRVALVPAAATVLIVLACSNLLVLGMAEYRNKTSDLLAESDIALLAALRDVVQPLDVVLTEGPWLSNEIPGLVGHAFGITFREAPQRRPNIAQDRTRFYNSRLLGAEQMTFLAKEGVDYVVVETESKLSDQMSMLPSFFSLVFASNLHSAYKVSLTGASPTEEVIVKANTLFLNGKLEEAKTLYNSVDMSSDQAPLAQLGKVYVTAAQGRRNETIAVYETLSSMLPGRPWIEWDRARRLAVAGHSSEAEKVLANLPQSDANTAARTSVLLGDLYVLRGDFEKARIAYMEAIWQNPQMFVAYEKLNDLLRDFQRMDLFSETYAALPTNNTAAVNIELGKALLSAASQEDLATRFR